MSLVPRLFASCLLATPLACGRGGQSGPTDTERTVAWRLQIVSESTFGVRIWLNGEAVYAVAAATAQGHHVEVERPFRPGEHVVEFEILAASADPSTYTAAWTVQVKPKGAMFTADGVPTLLSAGQRLTVRVPL
jgi:hypothetical protein